MTPCPDKRPLLGALLDGELDAANTIALEQHLKTCAGCSSELEALRAVSAAVRSPGVGHEAPEAFRRRLNIALAAQDRPARRASRGRGIAPWLGWSLAGGGGTLAAASVALMLFLGVRAPIVAFQAELVGDHVRSLMANHLVDVETSDRHTVKPWFNGRTPFAPSVIDLADRGFPLAGGRLDWARGERAAALVYRRRLHVINVFILPSSTVPAGASDGSRSGYNLVRWRKGGLDYWAVSDLDPKELAEFRDLYRSAMAG